MIITGFQLRAAKAALNLKLIQLSSKECIDISNVTLARLVNTVENYEKLSCSAVDAEKITNFFKKNKIIFKEDNIIEIDCITDTKDTKNNITRFQLVCARAALRMNLRVLSKNINIGYRTIGYLENKANNHYISCRNICIKDIISFFNTQYITFPSNTSVQLIKK